MKLDTIKSNLGDLAHAAINTVEESVQEGRDAIFDTTHSVGRDVSDAVGRTASTFMHSDAVRSLGNVASAVSSARAIAAAISPDMTWRHALYSVGLQRRPSTLARVLTSTGWLVVGASVGVGVVMLFAPRSGEETRARIARSFQSLRRRAGTTAQTAETKARDLVDDAEMKAHEVVRDAEAKAQDVVDDLGDRARSAMGEIKDISGASSRSRRTPGLSH